MTVEILNKYRADAQWCSLIGKLDGQLFELKRMESELVDSDQFECPVCAAPVSREDKICPYCRSELPVREAKGIWRKVRPTDEFLKAIEEAWAVYSDIFRTQRKIDMESEGTTDDEVLRRNIAVMQSSSLDLVLDTGPEDVLTAARNYETYVADYLLGVIEERYSIPFEAIRKSKASVDIDEVLKEFRRVIGKEQ